MNDKVKRLPGVTAQEAFGEPNPEAIDLLEKLLERAKQGSIQQLFAGGLDADGNAFTAFALTGNDCWSMQGVMPVMLQEHADILRAAEEHP